MLEKLNIVKQRFEEVNDLIIQPDVISDQKRYVQLNKEYKDLSILMKKREAYIAMQNAMKEAQELLGQETDPEMIEMAKMELEAAQALKPKLEEEIRFLLVPKDPEDAKNAVVEIRAGTGGDEASIFAGDLHRMYTKYCESKGWKTNVIDLNEGTSGGYKEIHFEVNGEDVYGTLKFEAGVHRVQRVPQTETQGRVHTSAATVMVIPEAEEFDVQIDPKDVRIDYFCSSGPGGQSVNTTDSAVRITHLPTGVTVSQQDEKSQHRNREKAMKVLRARLYEKEKFEKDQERASNRKSQIGSGDRSERIRTYNFPQGRVTDHRINLTLHKLSAVIESEGLQEIIDALAAEDKAQKLAGDKI